jgi:hypothetical protein
MPPRTTEAEFEALLHRAGLALTPAQIASIHSVFGAIEAMRDRIRNPVLPPEAEPATCFTAEPGQ